MVTPTAPTTVKNIFFKETEKSKKMICNILTLTPKADVIITAEDAEGGLSWDW